MVKRETGKMSSFLVSSFALPEFSEQLFFFLYETQPVVVTLQLARADPLLQAGQPLLQLLQQHHPVISTPTCFHTYLNHFVA